ncbi:MULTISPECIES: FAS1-like dehydratase domain-containing protein [Methylobacterium]|uniref:FAS1-like dehydratase domain-containing protein n=1 Tax=Methylobacterium TaxID=407 RepID=UPI0013EB4E60|nr:MaoC family dehydratase N-terminal domain-containing protein [Methylobacterium sp. DB0501]NGM37454.1 protein dehydratase [Methylobacterium sp. DB0501]
MTTLDIDHLRGWIGRSREVRDLVTPRLVDEFRATFTGALAPVGEGEAPLALHWCLAPETPAADALGSDGHAAKGGFLPPVPLPRRMWAGGEIEIVSPLRLGDEVVRRETVADVAVKEGRTGALCFVTVRHEYETPRGIAIRERQDIVYREAAKPGENAAGRAGAPPDFTPERVREVAATTTLLFRYSAMTFNGHRFHYDFPYATEVEGYPGLVVHGPIQASLLLNLAAESLGRAPRTFRYRGVSPMIAGQTFRVAGRSEGAAFTGATVDAAGGTCMQAAAGA